MTEKDIKQILDNRGYIIESDCANVASLSRTEMQKYSGASSTYVDQSSWVYALYNSKKITKDEIELRVSHKKDIAKYMCDNAKKFITVHYSDFYSFLSSLNINISNKKVIWDVVEEICEDFKTITGGAILSAIFIDDKNLPNSGFWSLNDVNLRIGTHSKSSFHQNELKLLQSRLSTTVCDMI